MIWIILTVLLIFADQLSKWLAVIFLEGRDSVYLIDGVLRFTYVENDGAAFGMLDDHRWVFLLFSSLAIAGILFYIFKFKPDSKLCMTGLVLVLSGGIGNMIDRILLGYVIDFIDFCAFPELWKWVFNIADSCVCIGAGLMILWVIIEAIKEYREGKAKKAVAPENTEPQKKESDGE